MKNLRGAHALLTGGSRGIGPSIGRALARAGVHLSLIARSEPELARVADELAALHIRAVPIAADIADASARRALVERAERALGPIDLLINNAAITQTIAFAEQAPADMARILETNLMANLALARLVLPGMLSRRRGHIVTVASVHGKKGQAYHAVYSATKAALIEWSGALRGELRGTGVSASAICPGLVSVGMWPACKTPPLLLGVSPPEAVAGAVVRAIRRDLQEVLVSPLPIRPLLALDALAPRLVSTLVKWMGYNRAARRIAEQMRSTPYA
jgi:short-subunit dehydrogenase